MPDPVTNHDTDPAPSARGAMLIVFGLVIAAVAITVLIAFVWNRSGLPQMPFGGIVLLALIGTLAVRWLARRVT